jgi:GMP synthase (glutamine-hydrolysing)
VGVTPRALVIQHEDDDPIHLLGGWMRGLDLDVVEAWNGDALPSTLDEYAALVVMGGYMGALDDETHSWLTATKELIRTAAADQVPTLGICLGHQLASVALGGEMQRNPNGRQFGLIDIGWNAEAEDDPLFSATYGAPRGLHYNDDVVVRLPDGAVQLATAPTGEVQAARLAETVWGVQWHPEVDEPLLRTWCDDIDPAVAARELAAMAAATAELEASWRPLGERFAELAGVRRTTGSAAHR